MVRSKNDVLEWYRKADAVTRIEFVCDLLKMCFPCELRLIGLCAEELGRRDSHPLKGHELRANSAVELQSACDDLSDAQARSKLAIYLCLLRPSNKACSSRLFDLLVTSSAGGLLPASGGSRGAQQPRAAARLPGDRLLLDDLLLLVTIAIHHPAFSVAQKYALVERLEALKDLLAELDPHVVTGKTADDSSTMLGSADSKGEEATAAGLLCRDSATEMASAGSSQGPGASSGNSPDLLLLPPLPGRQALPNSTAIQTKNEAERESGKDRMVVDECSPGSSSGGCHVAVLSSQSKTDSDLSGLRVPVLCNTTDDVIPATFCAPCESYSSSCSRSSSSCETKKPFPATRNRVPSARMRSAMPVDTSSSSPEYDSPASTPRLTVHRQGHRCESGGTRQSRRASRIGRHQSPSPVPGEGTCPSLFTPATVSTGIGVGTVCTELPPVVNVQSNSDSSSRRGGGREGDSAERQLLDQEQVTHVEPLASCALAAAAAVTGPEVPLLPFPHTASIVGAEEPAGKASVDDGLSALARPSAFPPAATDLGSGEQAQLAACLAPNLTDALDCSAAQPEVVDVHGGQPLASDISAQDDTCARLGLPLDESSQASSETLSDPVALSPTNELATSVSSGGEELALSGDSCLHTGPPLSGDPYGDYASRIGAGASSQVMAAPLPLPPQAGYAIAATHGSTMFMPGYGGIVYCGPMPVYYGSSARRPRRGGGGASAGHDLYYQQPCMQPCLVMHAAPLPPPMYCAPPPPPAPLQLPQQPGAETAAGQCGNSGGGGSLHSTGLPPPPSWTAATAACQRRVDFCYACGYSGHTGAQCPSQQQQPPQLTAGSGSEGLQRAV